MPMQAQSATDTQLSIRGMKSVPTLLRHHAKPANTQAARARRTETATMHTASPAASAASPLGESPTRYPGDLTYQGGNVVEYAQHHPIYLYSTSAGCTSPSCWGRPATFLQNLGESSLIHVTDQYTGNSADNRYTLGGGFFANIGPSSPTAPFLDAQMASLAYQASLLTGQSGYGHIYHIFLPPGQDECFDATSGECYSPDVPATFYFCAYHGSADFPDGTHVLYTVEGFQDVDGCSVEPGTPNGQLVDSTMSVLSHETFESITDPDPPTGWVNSTSNALYGEEIGDECTFIEFTATSAYFDAPGFRIGSRNYAVQREYNNNRHGCTEAP